MTIAIIEHEINALEARLRRAMQFDQWEMWTRDHEQRLENLKAELEEFKI